MGNSKSPLSPCATRHTYFPSWSFPLTRPLRRTKILKTAPKTTRVPKVIPTIAPAPRSSLELNGSSSVGACVAAGSNVSPVSIKSLEDGFTWSKAVINEPSSIAVTKRPSKFRRIFGSNPRVCNSAKTCWQRSVEGRPIGQSAGNIVGHMSIYNLIKVMRNTVI